MVPQAHVNKCKIELRRLQDEYDEFERRNSIIIIDLTKKASTGAAETARQVQLKTQMEQALLKATTMKVTAESALATCQNDLERSHIELRRESTSNEAAKSELTACKSNLNHARTELNESRSQPSLPDGNFEELLQPVDIALTRSASTSRTRSTRSMWTGQCRMAKVFATTSAVADVVTATVRISETPGATEKSEKIDAA